MLNHYGQQIFSDLNDHIEEIIVKREKRRSIQEREKAEHKHNLLEEILEYFHIQKHHHGNWYEVEHYYIDFRFYIWNKKIQQMSNSTTAACSSSASINDVVSELQLA